MSEKLGFLFGLFLFLCFILPFGLNAWYLHFQTDRLSSVSFEIQKLVSQEGGVTDNVRNVVTPLNQKGIKIDFMDSSNKEVTGTVEPGEKIYIYYHYTFKDIRGELVKFDSKNEILIQKRKVSI